jgi:uncharacterized DUF497 family protein
MSRPLRFIPEEGALVEITCRTIHSRYLLRPDPALNEIVLGVLGRAQRLHLVEPGYDPDHSEEEDRDILIARSNNDRLLLVIYTLRGEAIRIISARQLTRRETQDYEKGI